jgi:hypothetical protein
MAGRNIWSRCQSDGVISGLLGAGLGALVSAVLLQRRAAQRLQPPALANPVQPPPANRPMAPNQSSPTTLVRAAASAPSRGVIEPLDTLTLRARTVEIFPTAYSTLLSIVQGIALGVLVTTMQSALTSETPGTTRLVLFLEGGVALVGIVVVYYMYVWFVLVARWAPTIFDTLIPLGLGCLEMGSIASIGDNRAWVGWIGAFYIGGAVAFLHSVWRLDVSMFADPSQHRLITRLLLKLISANALGGTFAISGTVALRSQSAAPADFELFAQVLGTLVLLTAAFLILWSERTLARLYHSNHLRWIRSL